MLLLLLLLLLLFLSLLLRGCRCLFVFDIFAGVPYEISFTNLEKETRCPPGSECWVPGSVVVKINLNNEQDFILGFMDYDISPMTEFKNHTIRLLDVSYGRNGNYGKEKHYSIKLRVE